MSFSTENWAKIRRGVAEVISEAELKTKLSKKKSLRIKMGVDPTAPDLHLGHLVCLRKLRAFQDQGHVVEFIIGDYTAQIGDPSGRSTTRPSLTAKEVWENAKTYQEQVFRVLDKSKTEIHFNSTWFNTLATRGGLLDLMKQATVAQMLKRADFAKRYEEDSPITMLELFYPLLQGYDSVAVQADLELGGSDQKFNLLMGREFQTAHQQEPQVVMMMPLLEGLDGTKKMSKSYGNYVAFNDPSKEMFGKLMSVPDALMPKYVELLTDLDVPSLQKMHPKDAKILLAKTLTAQFHGDAAAQNAAEEFDKIFSKKIIPTDIPEFPVLPQTPNNGLEILLKAGIISSKNEGRRLLEQGAISEDGNILKGSEFVIRLNEGESRTYQVGKRRFLRIVAQK